MNEITSRPASTERLGSSTLTALFVLCVIVVVAASMLIQVSMRRQVFADAEATLAASAAGLPSAVDQSDQSNLLLSVQRMLQDQHVARVVVTGAASQPIIDARADAKLGAAGSSLVSATALSTWVPRAIWSKSVHQTLESQGRPIGTLAIDYEAKELAQAFVWTLLGASGLLGLASFLGWRTHQKLGAALQLPASAIEQLSQQITRSRDLSARLPPLTGGSLGHFEGVVNRLMEQLEHQEKKSSLHRARLEVEVDKRTKALAATNDRLRRLAYTSSETSLPNRAAFLDRLHKLCASPFSDREVLGVFVLRMTRVRYANEAFGFDVGDLMIESAATNLAAVASSPAEVFHLGGAEFAVIQINTPQEMSVLADDLLRVDAVPFVYRGATLTLLPKIGYAVYPLEANSVDDLTRFAMLALNVATSANATKKVVHYAPALLQETIELVHIESAIKRAVDNGHFEPYFQPRIDTRTGRVNGLEALIRWTSPELANYTNYELIPVAERSLLAADLDAKMLRKVVQWLAPLAAEGIHVPIAINLCAQSFERPALPDEISALVHSHGIDIGQIEIELVETVLVENNDVVMRNLMAFGDMGIGLLLDDYGTGYSSLRHLRDLPISTVKIDRVFIAGLPDHAASLAIVQSTIELAQRLGKRVVAEGVETYAQWETLRDLGCDEVQGYFLMRPVPAAAIAKMLRQQFETSGGSMSVDLSHLSDKSALVPDFNAS